MRSAETARSRALAPELGPWTLLGRYRRRVAFGAVMLLVTSVFALAIPYFLGRTIDALEGPNPAEIVPRLALIMACLAAAQAVTRILSRLALFNAARMAEYDLRSRLFSHLLTLEPAFFRAHPIGDVMSRLTSDVQTVRAMWGPAILNGINTTFVFSVALVLMLRIDPVLTAWAMLPFPAMVLIGLVYGRRIHRSSRAVQEELGSLSASVQEDLTGIAVIKNYTIEEERIRRFGRASTRLLERNMVLTRVRGQLVPILGAVAALGTAAVLWIGGTGVIEGRIELGQLVQFNAYLALLAWPILALGWMISLFQRGLASWRRLEVLLSARPAIAGGDGPALPPEEVRGDIELRDLTIEIDGRRLLDGVSLRLCAGTVTALVGRIGSGKSTLVEAIPRLLDVPAGTVFLDRRDVTDIPLADLRRAIGYAPQEAFLFSATIGENIARGAERGEEPADRARLLAAARAAGLDRDLAALPSGLDTVVGERGITLSGGQRQRVALARAIASEPRVLVLDDSLSSVDAETEAEILEHLQAVMKGRTSILISHRVAAVKRADQIAVLDEGRLVEVGSHDELYARGGLYAELYRTQLEPAAGSGAEERP